MKKFKLACLNQLNCLACLLFLIHVAAPAQITDDVHITTNTTWSGTVNVSADTYIDQDVTLTIDPGTNVIFDGFFSLQVQGNIIADGTPADSIKFLPAITTTGWNRIMFEFTPSVADSSKFSYCNFSYSKALQETSLPDEAGGAMYIGFFSKVSIKNCTFKYNYADAIGGAIFCRNASPVIINNVFENNQSNIDGGALGLNQSNSLIIGNLFVSNQTTDLGGAINFSGSGSQVTNNTFANNYAGYSGGAINIDSNSEPVFTNCIFYGNSAAFDGNEVSLTQQAGQPDFYYCLVSGGAAAFGGMGGGSYSGNYENNIDDNPQFTGSGATPYTIQISSPCLNSGSPDTTGLHLPAFDLAGNPRIAKGCDERIDIGAYENQSQATSSFSGTLSEDAHWCNDTIEITGDVLINDGVTLRIEAGVMLYFTGLYNFDVDGCLIAEGTNDKKITFKSHTTWPGWYGINFEDVNPANDTSVLRHCIIEYGNGGAGNGGGVYIKNSNKIKISGCDFRHNYANHGGGLMLDNSNISIDSCSFAYNTATKGAGLYASSSNFNITNCYFLENTAQSGDCNGTAASHGGAIFLSDCSASVSACKLSDNHADCKGGGIYASESSLTLENDSIQNNIATDCTTSGGGGGLACYTVTLCISQSYIANNTAPFGAGIFLHATNGSIQNNEICSNLCEGLSSCVISQGGGIVFSGGSNASLQNNMIHSNHAAYDAGLTISYSNPPVINNLIVNNHAGTAAGGISFIHASPLLLNNTICHNSAENFGGCIHFGNNSSSIPQFRNNIIYGNTVTYSNDDQVFIYDNTAQPNFYYCNVQYGKSGFGGYFTNYTGDYENNIDASPEFQNSGAYAYQLQQLSPCLNTGDATTDTTITGSTDLASNPRIRNGRIDMGCYEGNPSTDRYAGDAVTFSEAGDLIVLDNESHFDFEDSFTVEFWLNCTDMTEDNHLVIKKGNAWAVNLFYSPAIALLDFSVDSNGVFGYAQTTGTALINQWNHVAGVCKKREFGGYDVIIYLNGVKGTEDIENSLTHNDKPVTIGNDFFGKLDELRIWNKALSEREIRENMHLVINPIPDSLVCYHQFNRAITDFVVDIAGGNNGSLQNMSPEDCFVRSTVPAAAGTSYTQTVNSPGTVGFTGTALTVDFTAKTGEDEIVVSKLDTAANLNPEEANLPFNRQYWIVQQFGAGSFDANLSFTTLETPDIRDGLNPGRVKLFSRESNSDSQWILAADATAVDPQTHILTFDNLNHFSQFMMASKRYPDTTGGFALAFNGVNQSVNFGNSDDFNIVPGFTLEAWILLDEVSSNRDILRKGDIRFLYFDDNYESITGKGFQINLPDIGTGWWEFQYDIDFNRWYHVAWTLTETGDLKAYINGNQVRSGNFPGVIPANTDSLIFGPIGVDAPLKGTVDELRIWNIVRTQDQLRENMCKTLADAQIGLIGYWQFNDSTGMEVIDTESARNGTPENMADTNWVSSTAPVPFKSVSDGIWQSADTWMDAQGIPANPWSRVQINSSVTFDQQDTITEICIADTGSLSLSSSSMLTVSERLLNNAGNNGLLLSSTAAHTASLIHANEGIQATAERYIPQYLSDASGWHFLSSPVAQQAIRPEFVEFGNPVPGSNDFYKWDEITNYWINTKDGSGNWNMSFEDNFIVGRGYNVAYSENMTKSFAGELNVSDYTFNEFTSPAITYTAETGTGWNLMGNPYPSGLDWDLCQRANIDGAVYVYDGDNGQYISWNGTVGSLTGGIIPPMNAFFMKASANPELTILNDARVHTAANFYKSENFVEDLLVLKVEGNGFSDKTYIHFHPDATDGFDHDFDAYKLSGIEAAPQLYTKTGESKLSINELPYSNEEIIIPLSLKVRKDGDYTISVNENTFWETVDIALKDLQTQITYNLITNNPITFSHSTTNSPDRFLLLINGATGIEENPEDDGIEIYSYGNQVFIRTEEPCKYQVGVYNMLGQQVHSRTLTGFQTLSGFNTGFYLITVKTEKSWAPKKVFIR